MIKNHLKPLLLCFGVLCFINSCTNNEEVQTPVSETRQFENAFDLEHFQDAFIKENLVIHWDDFNIQQDRDHHIYEFNASLKVKNTLQNGENALAVNYKLLAFRDSDGSYTFELIKFLDDTGALNTVSYFNPASFSGTLYHYNLKGETIKIKAYKNGVLLNEFTDEEKGIIDAQSKAPEVAGCEEGCYVLIFTDHYTDYYLSIKGSAFAYAYSVYQGATSEWVWVGGNGGGGYGGSGGGGNYHYHFDDPHGPNIGTNNHPDEYVVEDIVAETPPSCESFNYSQVGGNNWQCAAIAGVHDLFTVFKWDCIGYDWGIFHQPLYFQLPVNNNFPLASGSTATASAIFLHDAFKAFDTWYKENACASGHAAMEQQLFRIH